MSSRIGRRGAATNDGVTFELETARRLRDLGWQTSATTVSGDWGADVVASCGDENLVVQCKDWLGSAGYDAIKDVVSARLYYEAQVAAVVSRAGFSRQATEAGRSFGIHLLRLDQLVSGCALDRTAEAARLRDERARQLAAQEAAKRAEDEAAARQTAVERWNIYDEAAATYRSRVGSWWNTWHPRWLRVALWTLICVVVSGMNSRNGDPTFGAIVGGVFVGMCHAWFVFTEPVEPHPPEMPRPESTPPKANAT